MVPDDAGAGRTLLSSSGNVLVNAGDGRMWGLSMSWLSSLVVVGSSSSSRWLPAMLMQVINIGHRMLSVRDIVAGWWHHHWMMTGWVVMVVVIC